MPLTAAQQQLVKDNMPLVYHIALRFSVPHIPREDLEQSGMLGLCYAAERFDASRGFRFTTLAFPCIRGFILRHINREHNPKHWPAGPQLSTLHDPDGNEPLVLADPINGQAIHQVDDREAIKLLLNALPAKYRRVVRMRFGLKDGSSMTMQEIGERLNLSRERIRQIIAAALERLRA